MIGAGEQNLKNSLTFHQTSKQHQHQWHSNKGEGGPGPQILACQKIFFLSKNFSCKNTKFGLTLLWKIQEQNQNSEHPLSLLSKNCKLLLRTF